MIPGESGQDDKRGREMFQWKVATEVARAMEVISGESGQDVKQEREIFQMGVACATWVCYQERDQGGERGREMFEKAVAMAMELIQNAKDDWRSLCLLIKAYSGRHKLAISRIGGNFVRPEQTPYTHPSYTGASAYAGYPPSPSASSYAGYPPPSSYLGYPSSPSASYAGYPSPPFPSVSFNGVMYACPGFTIDCGGGDGVSGGAPSHLNIRVGESPAAAHAHLRSIIGDAGPNIQALDPTGSFGQIGGSTARFARGYGGSQTEFLDYSGGRFVAIPINPLQEGDQGFVATTRNGKYGRGEVAQNALMSAFGGVVPMCFSTLDDALKDNNCPGYIRAATYAGLVVITGITFVGLISKKRAKAAVRVVASAAIAAVSTALVYKVSENVYLKCACGIMGAAATFATAAINW